MWDNQRLQFRRPRRPALGAACLMLVALLLGGCRIERPVVVSFPDDARVLDGDWEVVKTGLAGGIGRTAVASGSERIVLFQYPNTWLYELDVDGDWAEGDATPYEGFDSAVYDHFTGALVKFERSGAIVTVASVDLESGVATTQVVTLPNDVTLTNLAVGSGRLFALEGAATNSPRLHWWSILTGMPEGSGTLPPLPDGMRSSSNGRLLSFWDVNQGDVTIVDTTEPSRARTFYQGTCRGGWPAEGSDDGRWFATLNCGGTLTVLDLSESQPTWRSLGTKPNAAVEFARGSSRVVWQDDAGAVWANDVSTGETSQIRDAAGGPVEVWDPAAILNVDDVNGQIVAITGSGQVEVSRTGVTPELLPRLGAPSASMTLTATPPPGEPSFSGYAFAGELVWSGDPSPALPIEGRVGAFNFHDYRLSPQMAPAPSLQGMADIGPADAPLYTLQFRAETRRETEFLGVLHDETTAVAFSVKLSKKGN